MDEPLNFRRFGPFTLDLANGILSRDGKRIPLQPQPATVLVLLASRAGELVTRKELQSAVWTDGTIVDFDQGLNWCVKRIRDVLGDDAEHPRFIETVPRKGYRFLPGALVVDAAPVVDSGIDGDTDADDGTRPRHGKRCLPPAAPPPAPPGPAPT